MAKIKIKDLPRDQEISKKDLMKVMGGWDSVQNYELFGSEISASTITQGSLGDCYFLSALAATASDDPDTLSDMIKPKGGTYTVFFKL